MKQISMLSDFVMGMVIGWVSVGFLYIFWIIINAKIDERIKEVIRKCKKQN